MVYVGAALLTGALTLAARTISDICAHPSVARSICLLRCSTAGDGSIQNLRETMRVQRSSDPVRMKPVIIQQRRAVKRRAVQCLLVEPCEPKTQASRPEKKRIN